MRKNWRSNDEIKIVVQMQRYNHLEKLKSMDDLQRKAPLIPDYIDQNFINDYFFKKNEFHFKWWYP